jgi:co-chaperonin GroES (HSP10)
MKPLFARVLLEREKQEKIGSVLLPQDSQKRMAALRCKVIACGPTCEEDIKSLVGKDVLIGRHAGDWINEHGIPGIPDNGTVERYIVQEEDLLVALE